MNSHADKQPLAVGPLLAGTFHELVAVRGPLLLYLGAFGALSGLDQLADSLSVQLALHCLPLLLMGLSVTAYRTLNDEPERLAEAFGSNSRLTNLPHPRHPRAYVHV